MPHIWDEIHNFVELWNAHSIRSQPQRPRVKPGKPVVLYFTPPDSTHDYGQLAPVSAVLNYVQRFLHVVSCTSNLVALEYLYLNLLYINGM